MNTVAPDNNVVVVQQPKTKSIYQEWLPLDLLSQFTRILNVLQYKYYLWRWSCSDIIIQQSNYYQCDITKIPDDNLHDSVSEVAYYPLDKTKWVTLLLKMKNIWQI